MLSQTYTNFELIIINDCSTDNSPEIINNFSDPRIKVITNTQNLGISGALNKGLKYAKGEYIARSDADDVSFPDRLEIQLKCIDNKNVDLVCSNYLIEDVETGVLRENSYRKFSPDETKCHMFFYDITHGTVMFRKKIISNLKSVYLDRPAEDYDLFVRLAQKYKFYQINQNLVKVRVRKDSLCGIGGEMIKKDIDLKRLEQLIYLNINVTTKDARIHIGIIDKNYADLSEYTIREIYKWITKIIRVNNERKVFSNPYFNNQWKLRAVSLLKNRDKRKLVDVASYKILLYKLKISCDWKTLYYLYRYKNSEC